MQVPTRMPWGQVQQEPVPTVGLGPTPLSLALLLVSYVKQGNTIWALLLLFCRDWTRAVGLVGLVCALPPSLQPMVHLFQQAMPWMETQIPSPTQLMEIHGGPLTLVLLDRCKVPQYGTG